MCCVRQPTKICTPDPSFVSCNYSSSAYSSVKTTLFTLNLDLSYSSTISKRDRSGCWCRVASTIPTELEQSILRLTSDTARKRQQKRTILLSVTFIAENRVLISWENKNKNRTEVKLAILGTCRIS